MGPFAKKYPRAEVWVAPRQWSFPLNLPLAFLGLFPRKANVIEDGKEFLSGVPWGKEFEMAILNLTVGIGPFVEVSNRWMLLSIPFVSLLRCPTKAPLFC